ncbi:hypothetical protein [Stenomitos frigidus]|uniref:hypothetical protein n=1 Tax=Stenomitos frigidus TaxID=1886765 RepID=UPI0015E66EEE|nr:hypothetical protein [Stenomitos frigidus]
MWLTEAALPAGVPALRSIVIPIQSTIVADSSLVGGTALPCLYKMRRILDANW